MYHPRQALRNAINEWLPEFSKHKSAWGPIVKPQPAVAVIPVPIIPSINTCMTLTSTTTTTTGSNSQAVVNPTQLQALAEVCSSVSQSVVKTEFCVAFIVFNVLVECDGFLFPGRSR